MCGGTFKKYFDKFICQDFMHVMTNVGEKMTEEEVNDLVKMTGAAEHGRINYVSK